MRDNDPWRWVYTTPNPNLRAADADRESVAESLRAHHADGRLDTDELTERIGRCYEATTVGELDRLLVDLPRAPAAERRSARHPALWRLAAVLVPVWFSLAATSALTGVHLLWLVIPTAMIARRYVRTRRPLWGTPAYPSPG